MGVLSTLKRLLMESNWSLSLCTCKFVSKLKRPVLLLVDSELMFSLIDIFFGVSLHYVQWLYWVWCHFLEFIIHVFVLKIQTQREQLNWVGLDIIITDRPVVSDIPRNCVGVDVIAMSAATLARIVWERQNIGNGYVKSIVILCQFILHVHTRLHKQSFQCTQYAHFNDCTNRH
jgi:hypothetical protein